MFILTRLSGSLAHLLLDVNATQQDLEILTRHLGLDKPLPVQYAIYVKNIAQGDCGTSILTRRPVTEDVTIQAPYLELLREVQAQTSVAILSVTHDFGIVAANANRVAVMYPGRIVEMGSTLQIFDRPSHPYTQALLRCLPDVELKRAQLVEIGGQPPDLAHLAPGCPFAPRCAQRQPICVEEYPPTVTTGNGHMAQCWVATAVEA